jgi:hypothetical protein
MHGADPQAIEAVDRNGGLRCRLGSNQLETWVIEDYCYAGSLQQAVQQGGMQRFQEDGIPQMVSECSRQHRVAGLAALDCCEGCMRIDAEAHGVCVLHGKARGGL